MTPNLVAEERLVRNEYWFEFAGRRQTSGALYLAQQAFLAVLDEYTLDQFMARRADLVVLLGHSLEQPTGGDEAGAITG